jgi:hypothetical protein
LSPSLKGFCGTETAAVVISFNLLSLSLPSLTSAEQVHAARVTQRNALKIPAVYFAIKALAGKLIQTVIICMYIGRISAAVTHSLGAQAHAVSDANLARTYERV